MRGVMLDRDSLHPEDLDFSGLAATLTDWDWHPSTAVAELPGRLAGREVVVTNKVPLDGAAIREAVDLRLICVAATGVDNVDLGAARARGIPVCNVRNYGTAAVGQHVLALLLALATRWHQYAADVRAGAWSRADNFCLMHRPVMELAGKTLGIIGFGALGREVARLGEAFGMQVRVAHSLRPDAAPEPGRLPLAQLLADSDVVSLHCPLSAQTQGLVNEAFLAAMKPGALLINTARGGLVDAQALRQALCTGRLAGAALDVLDREPPPAEHPLLDPDIPNLLVTPHCAWVSRESRQRLVEAIAANVRAWRAGQPIHRMA
jgi:glycerate dehydrogenase